MHRLSSRFARSFIQPASMPQLVFIHGPGAGGCGDAFVNQLRHFPGSLAPTLPGHLQGEHCHDVARFTEWLRGWLWAQNHNKDLVLVGYTLGACIAIQYGLDYPDEVMGIVGMTVAIRPKERPASNYEMRLRALKDPGAYEEWREYQRKSMKLIDAALSERLMQKLIGMGPMVQYHDMRTIDAFDVRGRITTLRPKLLLLRGLQDHGSPPP